ncbi:MAG: TetR/AcrR family transcriptional regulator [Planctomycetota bacterium]
MSASTEERLLDAALTLFAERGYEATSVRAILDEVGVTAPVLYHHFGSKEQLFERLVRWKHEEAVVEMEEFVASPFGATERLRAILRGTFAFCVDEPRVTQLMFQTWYGPSASGLREIVHAHAERRFLLVAGVVQDGLDAGELRGGDAASLALVFCSLMDHHCGALARTEQPGRMLTPERADALLDVFLHGAGGGRRRAPALPPFAAAEDAAR